MEYLRLREQKLRDTNESTNERVKWFALGTMGMLVGLGAWQVVYLRAYFRYVVELWCECVVLIVWTDRSISSRCVMMSKYLPGLEVPHRRVDYDMVWMILTSPSDKSFACFGSVTSLDFFRGFCGSAYTDSSASVLHNLFLFISWILHSLQVPLLPLPSTSIANHAEKARFFGSFKLIGF